jgi:molybdopterin-containing oxidoreductase family membrane subunit
MNLPFPPHGIDRQIDLHGVTKLVSDTVLRPRPGLRWWVAAGISFAFTLLFVIGLIWSFEIGPGLWGNNASQIWGFAIINYVFWLGVGHAGTLISSLLWLTGQRWRPAVNRFSETMTFVAVCIAGLFPIVHLGRPMYVLWIAPIPVHQGVWAQARSALVWDFWAVASYLSFSTLFLYVGLIPDFATLRDRARRRATAIFYGLLALGWRGSARQWRLHRALHALMSGIAVPLVVSVHSIVGLDFAASVMPGWNDSLIPPYFVVGALFSGFATTALIGAWLRWGLGLERILRPAHFEAIARILLASSVIMGVSYGTEWLAAWRSGSADDLRQLTRYAFSSSGWIYWLMLACNVAIPQLYWIGRFRRSIPAMVAIALLIDVGMWVERYLIVLGPLGHGHVVSAWRHFDATYVDVMLLAGSVGFFCFAILILARILPIIAMHGMKALIAREPGA